MNATIAVLWQDFLATTYSGGSKMTADLRRELRLNFYSGFNAALMTLADVGRQGDAVSVAVEIRKYIDEFQAFAADYLKERQGEQ